MEGTTGYSQQQPSDNSSPLASQAFIVEQLLSRVSTMKPVKVMAVDTAAGTVDVQPLISQVDGQNNVTPHGTIYGIPYVRAQGGNSAIILDPKVDDIGMMAVADRDMSAVKASKKVSPPGSGRRFSLADGVYIGGFLNPDANQKVEFTDAGIAVNKVNVNTDGQVTTDLPVLGNVTVGPAGPNQVNVNAHKYLNAGQSGVVQSVAGTFLPIAAGAIGSVLKQLAGGAYGFGAASGSSFISIDDHGGVPDGVTDNTAAWNACWSLLLAAGNGTGGGIQFGAGRYAFAGPIPETLPSTAFTLVVQGIGSGATELYWPSGSGITITSTTTNQRNNVQFRGMSFVTGNSGIGLGAGFGLTLSAPDLNFDNLFSTIDDVVFKGDNWIGTHYWAIGLDIHTWSYFTISNCYFTGNNGAPGTISAGGIGCRLMGDTVNGRYGVIYNFIGCNFYSNDYAIQYGPYTQGVTVGQCNFNGNNGSASILCGPAASGSLLSLLAVSNCQFAGAAYAIWQQDVCFSTSVFASTVSCTIPGSIGLNLPYCFMTEIAGCTFNHYTAATGSVAIQISGQGEATIIGNNFRDLVYFIQIFGSGHTTILGNVFSNSPNPAYNLYGTTTGCKTSHNSFVQPINGGGSNPVFSDIGTGNTCGGTSF